MPYNARTIQSLSHSCSRTHYMHKQWIRTNKNNTLLYISTTQTHWNEWMIGNIERIKKNVSKRIKLNEPLKYQNGFETANNNNNNRFKYYFMPNITTHYSGYGRQICPHGFIGMRADERERERTRESTLCESMMTARKHIILHHFIRYRNKNTWFNLKKAHIPICDVCYLLRLG